MLVALALVVTFRLMPATASGRGATLTVGVTARLDLDVARADIGESLELASIEPPQLPPLVGQAARNVALAAAPEVDSNALREEARRVRRFALRTPSGRQIHWVLDSEFAGLSTGGDE